MTTVEMKNMLSMPRREKLQMMEILWEDLSRETADHETPGWHRQLLRETEKRVMAGREPIMDWTDAKQQLRARGE